MIRSIDYIRLASSWSKDLVIAAQERLHVLATVANTLRSSPVEEPYALFSLIGFAI